MIFIKTAEEIALMRESNLLVSKTHALLAREIKEGVTSNYLDKIANEFIKDNGAVPGFLNYNGYPKSLCISVNDVVVHGIPNDVPLKYGDIVSVDCGVYKNGFHGDSAYTFTVGKVSKEIDKLLEVTKKALYLGIAQAVAGKRVGDIGYAIQTYTESFGFSVVRELVGHGIGRKLHEKPEVPNYGKSGQGIKLVENMAIAIEPMINMGKKEVKQMPDGWTIKTADGKPSAHFEHTVIVKKDKAEILSNFEIIERELNRESK
ncbi:MAG TPA: type I methionyl aminopeptidase [Bacteroidales bacterium]|mgnify:FL=1|nr:type I methionyl aminopeptidase [Bacteroidales bacterium]